MAVGGQQDVRRLQVTVGHPPPLGVIERLGEPGDDPGDGPGIGESSDDLAGRADDVGPGILRGGDLVEDGEQAASPRGPPPGRLLGGEDRREGRAPQERHADELEQAVLGDAMPEDLDDVRMPDAGQEPRFRGDPRGDLHHHEPAIEVGLLGEEDASEPATAQLADQEIRADLVADLGQGCRIGPVAEPRRAERAVQGEQPPERVALGGEPLEVIGRDLGSGRPTRPGSTRGRSARPRRPHDRGADAPGIPRRRGSRRVPSGR